MLDRTRRGAIFADARVFSADWVPGDFHSRDAQLNTMATALEPVIEGEAATGLLLHGPSGTGKTSSSRYLLQKLGEHTTGLRTAVVNCWTHHSRYRVLSRVLEAVDGAAAARHDHAASALRESLGDVDDHVVVVLDEADQLDEPDVIYDLYEERDLEVIVTANDRSDVFRGLDDRIQSRLRTFTDVAFPRNTADDLVPILEQRVKHGLQPDVVTADLVGDVARAANGNARDAIAALEGAAQRAVEDGTDHIRPDHVATAIDTASHEVRKATLDRLNDHQTAIYEIVAADGPISPGTIYERYVDRVSEPRSRRTVRKYARKLEQYDLFTATGAAQTRTYRLVADAPRPD